MQQVIMWIVALAISLWRIVDPMRPATFAPLPETVYLPILNPRGPFAMVECPTCCRQWARLPQYVGTFDDVCVPCHLASLRL